MKKVFKSQKYCNIEDTANEFMQDEIAKHVNEYNSISIKFYYGKNILNQLSIKEIMKNADLISEKIDKTADISIDATEDMEFMNDKDNNNYIQLVVRLENKKKGE